MCWKHLLFIALYCGSVLCAGNTYYDGDGDEPVDRPISLSRERRSSQLTPGGTNVCPFKQTKTIYESKEVVVATLIKTTVCCSDFLRCWKHCDRSKPVYKKVMKTNSRNVEVNTYHCCQGWTVDASGTQCARPLCNPPCRNNGVCSKPGKCLCKPGYEGLYCQNDINECLVPIKTGCLQQCINLPGTFTCACKRGYYSKDSLSRTCDDIDECKHNPCGCFGGNCLSACDNTPGSYRCRCGPGYRLSRNNLCTDRNECLENIDICPHRCVNTPGSYKCTCFKGFTWNANAKKCEAIDTCAIGNGGCRHKCIPIFVGNVCSCRAGFTLSGTDFVTCLDFNECNGLTECDSVSSTCVNTPGDYHCQCKTGFKYSSNNRTCEDRNECAEAISSCDHDCRNTIGSYACSCRPGFRLLADGKSCQDIDECQSNRCDQTCVNMVGSFRCDCRPGYILDVDGNTCRPQLCEELIPPFYGSAYCEGRTMGKWCHFKCSKGYARIGSGSRQCLASGSWSGEITKCYPKECGVPRPPLHGKVTLPCDVSYQSTCPVSCKQGYRLRGPEFLTCSVENGVLTWNKTRSYCEEILVCKPNPCRNGGQCRIETYTKYSCNCTGTGHVGQHCEIGVVTLPQFPKLNVGVPSASLMIQAKPRSRVNIAIVSDPGLTVSPSNLTIVHPRVDHRITVSSSSPGLKRLSYVVLSDEDFLPLTESVLLAYDATADPSVASLAVLHSDCYKITLSHRNMMRCAPIELRSTASWLPNARFASTSGTVFIKVGKAALPLTLQGGDALNILAARRYDTDITFPSSQGGSGCSERRLSPSQMQYAAKTDLFTKHAFEQFNKLTPDWFSIELKEELLQFTRDNIQGRLMSGSELKGHSACASMSIDTDSLFVVYFHREHIAINVHDKQVLLRSGGVFCIAVDVCRKEPHLALPKDSLGHLENVLSFNEIQSLGWHVSVQSIGFARRSPFESTRQCLMPAKLDGGSASNVVFGGVAMTATYKTSFKGRLSGTMTVGVETINGKEDMLKGQQCMDGNTKFETPAWSSSDIPKNQYEEDTVPHVTTLKEKTLTTTEDELSLLQRHGAVFRMKSGLRPILQKTSHPVSITAEFKSTATSTTATGDHNFNKITQLEMLGFPLMDIEGVTMGMTATTPSLSTDFENFKLEVSSWSFQMQDDIMDMYMNFDTNSQLVSDKLKTHYYKTKSFLPDLKAMLTRLNADVANVYPPGDIALLSNSYSDIEAMAKILEPMVVVQQSPKLFQTLAVQFNGSVCLFPPCITDTVIKMHPLSTDVGHLGQFCHDPSKGPFDMWQTETTFMQSQKVGEFFEFTSGKHAYLCLAVDGVKKARFDGNLMLFGNKLPRIFVMNDRKMTLAKGNMALFGNYKFRVNATVDLSLNNWGMVSVAVEGAAFGGGNFLNALQRQLDKLTVTQYYALQKRVENARSVLLNIEQKKIIIAGQMASDRRRVLEARTKAREAALTHLRGKQDYQSNLNTFKGYQTELNMIENGIKNECTIATCNYACVEVEKCDVCQNKIYINKTLPNCKEVKEDRSYAHLKSDKAVCSHVVEDRTLKYTGNCKKPGPEPAFAKSIVDRINNKVKNNESLTIEDAMYLEQINETAGKQLRSSIEQQNFFKSFPRRFQDGALSEDDFKLLAKYKNASFAEQIREQMHEIIRAKVLTEIATKLNQSKKLTEEDFRRIREVDPEVEKQLRQGQGLQAIHESIAAGRNLTAEELAFLNATSPEQAKNITESIRNAQTMQRVMSNIQKKISAGSLTPSDIEALEKVNPGAAEKLKAALKEQLKKTVEEMQKNMKNVKNAINQGFNGSDFGVLTQQLNSISKGMKPIDRAELASLQRKLTASSATNGSVLEELAERIDLAISIGNITGVSDDLKRVTKAFFGVLSRIELPEILKSTQAGILTGIKNAQEWYITASNVFDKLCQTCGDNCNQDNTLGKVLVSLGDGLTQFKSKICLGGWSFASKIPGISSVCAEVNSIEAFLLTTATITKAECGKIERQVVKPLRKIAELFKGTRLDVVKAFDEAWQSQPQVTAVLNNYNLLDSSLRSAYAPLLGIQLPVPTKSSIVKEVSESIRSRNVSVLSAEYRAATLAVKKLAKAIENIPAEMKRLQKTSLSSAVPTTTIQLIVKRYQAMRAALLGTLQNLCPGKSLDDITLLSNVLASVDRDLKSVLSSRSFDDVFRNAQRVGSSLKESMILSDRIKDTTKACSEQIKVVDPFSDLKHFLEKVVPLAKRSYKDIIQDVKKAMESLKNGVKSPVGKVVKSLETFADNSPMFNLPLILSMRPKFSIVAMTSVENYFTSAGNLFGGLVDVIKKCKDCRPEEIFGKDGLKSISMKFDNYLKPISKNISRFVKDISYTSPGIPLLYASLERVRTAFQTIYKSGTGMNLEGIEKIAMALKRSKEAVTEVKTGYRTMYNALAGVDNKKIKQLKKDVQSVGGLVMAMYQKSEGSLEDMKAAFDAIDKAGRIISNLPDKVEQIGRGPLEARLQVAKEIGNSVKQLTGELPSLVSKKLNSAASTFLDGQFLNELGPKLQSIASTVDDLVTETSGVMTRLGVSAPVPDPTKGLKSVQFESSILQLKQASFANRATIARSIETKTTKSAGFLSSVADAARGIYEDVTGIVSDLQAKYEQLMRRMDKYAVIYRDVMATVKELKAGPLSNIGEIKDAAEELVASISDYNLAKLMTAEPGVARRKVNELKELMSTTASTLSSIDTILKKCQSCKVESIIGYRFIGRMAKTLDQTFTWMLSGVTKLADAADDTIGELRTISGAVSEVKDRFQAITKSGKFDSKTLSDLSTALVSSSPELDQIANGAQNIAEILFGQDVDLQVLGGSLDSVIEKVSGLLSKSSAVLANVEAVKTTAVGMRTQFNNIRNSVSGLKQGGLKRRLELAKEMSAQLSGLVSVLPKLFDQNVAVLQSLGLDTEWISNFGNNVESIRNAINSVTEKTDKVLNAAGYVVTGVEGVKGKLPSVKASIDAIAAAPWDKKLLVANKAMMQVGATFDVAFKSISLAVGEFDIDLTKNDLVQAAETLVGKERLAKYKGIYKTTLGKLQQLQQGPISEIGKLTDAVEGFVDGLEGYDIGQALLSDPASFKLKITEFQQLASSTGDILKSVASITGLCTGCSLEKVFGKGFAKDLSATVGTKFDELHNKISNVADRVKIGYAGYEQVVKTAKALSSAFKGLNLQNGAITPATFDSAADILNQSAYNIEHLKGASSKIFKAIFDDDKELEALQTQFEGFVDQVGGFLNKSSIVSANIADVYTTVTDVKKVFTSINGDIDKLNEGPLETRVKVVRSIVGGVNKIMKTFPTLLEESAKLGTSVGINGTWMRRFGSRLTGVASSVSKVLQKTDSVLEGVGATAQGVTNITGLSRGIERDFQELLAAPWSQKFVIFNRASGKMSSILAQADGVASNMDKTLQALTGSSFNISNGLGYITGTVSGFIANVTKGVKFVEEIFIDVTNTIEAVKSGPIEKIGALTDSTKELFRSLDQYNLAEILMLAPKAVKTKIGEVKEIIGDAGAVLKNISSIVTKICPACNLDDILGSGFVRNVTGSLEKGISRLAENVTSIVEKVGEGAGEVQDIINSVDSIKNSVKQLKGLKFDSESFKKVSDILVSSSHNVDAIMKSSNNIYRLLFNDSLDMQLLKGKFEGFVSNMAGMLEKVGNFSGKIGDAFKSVEDVTKIFQQVGSNFDDLTEGPIASRLAAVQGIVKGVDSVLDALPDIMNKVSLGLESTEFLRKFGQQIADVTGGVRDVLNKTSLIVGDLGEAVNGVQGIGSTVSQIDQKFGQLLKAPWDKKFDIAKDMINSAKQLTGQVNGVASNVNSIVETITGKTLLSGTLFGNSTANLLDQMSNGVTLIADRYEKFRVLTNTIGEAFNNISSDPVKFALEGLPKLFNEADEFIGDLMKDTKEIASKLGIELNKFNLDPALVKAAQNFYGFAKSSMGAIQSGKELVDNFKKLFDSKDFKEAMVNFKKVTDSGAGFIQNIDELGSFIFKGDWEGMKGNFQETLDGIGESLGVNMEQVGEMFTEAFEVVSGVLSIAGSIEKLLDMKEFNAETVMQAAKTALNLAKTAVNLMNKLGANIGTKALESVASKVTVVVAVVQIVKGVSDFIKWINDVCDITYESVVTPKNLTYVCLKERLVVEDIKVLVEHCSSVIKPIEIGYGEEDYCCYGKQCVYIQPPTCLKQNEDCLTKRLLKAKSLPNVRRDLIVTYEGMRRSQQTMDTAKIDIEAAQYIERGAQFSWNRTSSSLYRINRVHERTNVSYFAMNNELIGLGGTINKFSNKSKIVLRHANFKTVLYHPSTSRLPMTLTAINHLGRNMQFNVVVDLADPSDRHLEHTARMVLTNTVRFVPYHRRRRSAGSSIVADEFHQLSVEGWAVKCGIFNDFMTTLKSSIVGLEATASRITLSGTPPSSGVMLTSSSPEAAATQLVNELSRQNKVVQHTLPSAIAHWKASVETQLLSDIGDTCVDYSDCIETFFTNVTLMLDPSMQQHAKAVSSASTLSMQLLELVKVASTASLRSRIAQVKLSMTQLEKSVGFCSGPPTMFPELPPSHVAYVGKSLQLECTVKSLERVTYKWMRNETVLPNQSQRKLTIPSMSQHDRGYYKCVGSTFISDVSSASTLVVVRDRPLITLHPVDVTVTPPYSLSATFLCNASISDGVLYQWKFLNHYASVAKTVGYGAALQIDNVVASNAGRYWCDVTDGNVIVSSRAASLNILSRANKREYVTLTVKIQLTTNAQKKQCALPDSLSASGAELTNEAGLYLRRELNLTLSRGALAVEYYQETETGSSATLKVEISVETRTAAATTDGVALAMATAGERTTMQQQVQGLLRKSSEGMLHLPWKQCQWQLKAAAKNADWLAEEMACPAGMNLSPGRLQCVSCAPGTYDDGKGRCSLCPIGSYQSVSGQSVCQPCPNNQLTSASGAVNVASCVTKDIVCYGSVDLVVVMDVSSDLGSVGFASIKRLVRDLIERLNRTAVSARVSVIALAKDASLVYNDLPVSAQASIDSVTQLQPGSAGRRFDSGLRLARKVLGSSKTTLGRRRLVLSVIGGLATPSRLKPSQVLIQNEAQQAKDQGIELFSVSVASKSASRDVVSATSNPMAGHLYSVDGFAKMAQSSSVLCQMLCSDS